ncbi:MAG: hypothetical protein RIS70_3959 [Planctomycetota bacterium]|jgi:hypothetical protein
MGVLTAYYPAGVAIATNYDGVSSAAELHSSGHPEVMEAGHFDADAYAASGRCPWTFFAFPRSLADQDGLPRDPDARSLLAAIRDLGVPASAWVNAATPGTVYYACPYESRDALDDALLTLAARWRWGAGSLSQLSERLFALAAQSPELTDTMDSRQRPE